MTLIIDNTTTCPHCGAYFQENGHCASGHPNRLEPVQEFWTDGEVANPFPGFLVAATTRHPLGGVQNTFRAAEGCEILMEPYELTDNQGHSCEALGILRSPSTSVPFHAYSAIGFGETLTAYHPMPNCYTATEPYEQTNPVKALEDMARDYAARRAALVDQPFKESIASMIRDGRTALNLSVTQLSCYSSVRMATVRRLENAKGKVSYEHQDDDYAADKLYRILAILYPKKGD